MSAPDRPRILVVNAGSSTVKLSLIGEGERPLHTLELAAPQAVVDPDELRSALEEGLGEADAVGHRIVHGGRRFHQPVRVDADIRRALAELSDLAPLHQPKSIAALDAVCDALPELPAVACFDTAFHATLTAAAATYALPKSWRERWGLRRYGFHGLSHAWVSRRVPALIGCPADVRIVSCHLGAGASMCAIAGGASRDTTMGFTPLEGLVMATRSGSIDPGMVLWLLEKEALSERELASALEHDSGLKGLAGSADMREVLERAQAHDGDALLALEVYVHRLRAGVASMAAALGGLDVLVFTGGIGQRSAPIRSHTSGGLGFLGVEIDERRNVSGEEDREISAPGAPVRTVVIAAREDLEIAHQARSLLGTSP